jgi:predicted DNA-binding transcriptional regulator YafY
MPKKQNDATSGEKLLRMFRRLMSSGKKHFQIDLAEYLECSPQTIMRMAYEIEGVIGTSFESGIENNRRWYSINSQKHNNLGLDCEELRYLSICRDLSVGVLPEKVIERIDESIFKLAMAMAEPQKEFKNQLTFFSKGRIDYAPHLKKIDKLVQAIEQKLVCLIHYKSASRTEPKEHRFAPGRIASMNNTLYVIGANLTDDMKEVRYEQCLAVHRIYEVSATDKHFVFELSELTPDIFGLPWHEPKTFEIRFKAGRAAEYVKERIWSDEQTLTDTDDGGVLLRITTQSEPELMSWVRSFGDEAEIV